jgi:hypothetical protein
MAYLQSPIFHGKNRKCPVNEKRQNKEKEKFSNKTSSSARGFILE